jgi:hypothetical protein
MSTFWANVDVEWLDGRNETYRVGGYASRYEAVRVDGGVLTLWLGNSAYGPYENVASIPIDVLRFWKIREGF